ncbi:C2H2 transcription factor Crz1 [Arthroderma uncinatum]|uniref:C2H2 transcription factor Crz1 n=1 Tax=Arthroderma uncinatum TaxID=74035 RepID=UPI00144A7E06|nr:C2H2 transcription factor Crz1 [Arthroderma uncinatum]KAF3491847.1 C2H2 transcription factor Crz1 [Arthroderma uncinatum]
MEAPSQNGRARSSSAARSNSNSHFTQVQNNLNSLQFTDPTNNNQLHADQSLSGNNNNNTYPTTTSSSNEQFLFTTPYLAATSQDGLGFTTNVTAPERAFNQQEDFSQAFDTSFLDQLEQPGTGVNDSRDSQPFPDFDNSDQGFNFEEFGTFTHQDQTSGFNTSNAMMGTIQQPTINPANFAHPLSSPQMPTSPHLVPPETVSSPNRPASPAAASSPGTFYTPQHSRHTSLDPASAAYITSGGVQSDWQGILGQSSFQGHRRAPSEHSDVSSVSHSPFLPQHDTFDASTHASAHPSAHPSPHLPPQTDPSLYDNAFGMETFTISEREQKRGYSPGHSPYISPRLSPQLHNAELDPDNSLLLAQHMPQNSTQDPYSSTSAPSMPGFQAQTGPGDMGQAAQMTPPSINVEFAPPSRTSTVDAPKLNADGDTLSPPISRARGRSKSDPYMSRPMSPSSLGSVLGGATSNTSSLSPSRVSGGAFSTPSSREASPASKNRRQSTSSLDNRTYILDLANPQRPGSNPQDPKRVQKHPATFQCTLCPKKFTRAYNLRSHLRTHTDERPFVCTICGRAFARQHDRRRHESLHSGERRFVCRGDMSSGRQWGCGRRFARADALGRHFRSEAGRVCIKPLLDEEAIERDNLNQQQQHQQQQGGTPQGHLQPTNQPLTVQGMDGHGGSFTLPAALLAQYPALQGLQWDQMVAPVDDNSDIGGRSSFDASSGGEFGFGDEEDSVNAGYLNHSPGQQQQQMGGDPLNPGAAGGGWPQSNQSWANEYNGIR